MLRAMKDTADIAFGRDAVISRRELKPFVKRTDREGLCHFCGHTAALLVTGGMVYAALGSLWVVPATLLHGFVMAFLFAPVHECSHGTPFRTRWLNETVYWVYALVYLVPPTFFRYSHGTHHTYTQIRGKDPDMVLPERSTVFDYLYYVSAVPFWMRNLRWYVQHALGRVRPSERYFLPDGQLPRVYREARIIWVLYALVGLTAVYFASWTPVTLWLIPRVVGEPFMRWIRVAEHVECPESADLRINTRTTRAPAWLKVLFWNMPYHAEHHLCPSVPFHALPALHRKVGGQLHDVGEGYLRVHAYILGRLRRGEGVTWAADGEAVARR